MVRVGGGYDGVGKRMIRFFLSATHLTFGGQGRGEGHFFTHAIIRSGPPLPCSIFIGRATMYEPFAGSLSRLATFSNAGIFFANNIWWVLKSFDWP